MLVASILLLLGCVVRMLWLRNRSHPSVAQAAFAERRGLPASPRSFDSSIDAKRVLQAALLLQKQSALAKQLRRAHWGVVGDIELAAIDTASACIAAVSENLPPDVFVAVCAGQLDDLIVVYRNDSSDPDGYGLGTLYVIKRVLYQ